MYLVLLASYLVNLLMFYFLYIFFYHLYVFYDQYKTKEPVTQTTEIKNKIKTDAYNLYLFFKIFFIIGVVFLALALLTVVLNPKLIKRSL